MFSTGYFKKVNERMDEEDNRYIKSPSIFDPAVILELKVCKEPKDIYKMCDEALAQIEKNKYDDELRQKGYENIIKYGISFYKKDCIIKLGEE